jgi:hypothetical protein
MSTESPEPEQAGKTIVALGVVNAENIQETRLLKRRAPIYGIDTVKTAVDSQTQLRMIDGGLISLTPLSQLDISQYDFDTKTSEGSVALSLIKGGLRTVTGLLTNKTKNYQLSTPVASIGVRGTHYSAHIDNGDLLLAVWDGEIIVQVTVGKSPIKFELGKNLSYSMARVKSNGEVEYLSQTPPQLALGHSLKSLITITNPNQDFSEQNPLFIQQPIDYNNTAFNNNNNQYDQLGTEWIDNQYLFAKLIPSSDGISRSGSANFGLIQHSFSSSLGSVSDIAMSLSVDFTLSRIPTGNLSFTDSGGEWFAVFNGVIQESSLDLNINFASHGNNLADGTITGLFVDNANQIFGNIALEETTNSSINAGGGFVLGEIIP